MVGSTPELGFNVNLSLAPKNCLGSRKKEEKGKEFKVKKGEYKHSTKEGKNVQTNGEDEKIRMKLKERNWKSF